MTTEYKPKRLKKTVRGEIGAAVVNQMAGKMLVWLCASIAITSALITYAASSEFFAKSSAANDGGVVLGIMLLSVAVISTAAFFWLSVNMQEAIRYKKQGKIRFVSGLMVSISSVGLIAYIALGIPAFSLWTGVRLLLVMADLLALWSYFVNRTILDDYWNKHKVRS